MTVMLLLALALAAAIFAILGLAAVTVDKVKEWQRSKRGKA
jgi:hypothetical protein